MRYLFELLLLIHIILAQSCAIPYSGGYYGVRPLMREGKRVTTGLSFAGTKVSSFIPSLMIPSFHYRRGLTDDLSIGGGLSGALYQGEWGISLYGDGRWILLSHPVDDRYGRRFDVILSGGGGGALTESNLYYGIHAGTALSLLVSEKFLPYIALLPLYSMDYNYGFKTLHLVSPIGFEYMLCPGVGIVVEGTIFNSIQWYNEYRDKSFAFDIFIGINYSWGNM